MADLIGIKECAEKTGLSETVIRAWEARYGYPKPKRTKRNYRLYTKKHVEDLTRIRLMTQSGTSVGDIIKDGIPHFQTEQIIPNYAEKFNFSVIPKPETEAALAVRKGLEFAIHQKNIAGIRLAMQLSLTLHPKDRDNAVWQLIKLSGVKVTP